MPNINIEVATKIATNMSPGTPIVCGNNDYTVTFIFDAEWAAQAMKTARFVFVRDGAVRFQDVVFSGSVATVPVLYEIAEVYVGVYAGDLHTTTPAKIHCDRSILCGTGLDHEEPDPDVYNQILEEVNRLIGLTGDHPARMDNPHNVTAEQVGARPDTWTPTAADVGAATPAAVNAAVKKAAPYNLLDNSDFRNPVNQRGQQTYTGLEYSIDRWVISGNAGEQNTIWVDNGYIGLSGGNTTENVWLVQRVPANVMQIGSKATFAVKQNGYTYPFILNINAWGTDASITFENGVTLLYQAGELIIYNGTGAPAGFNWAALYEGEYTAETLPEYRPKGYAAELAECQRYYVKLSQNIPMFCYSAEGRQVRGTLVAPTKMRVFPSVVNHTIAWIYMGGYDTSTSGNTTLAVNEANDGIDISVTLPANISPTAGNLYMVAVNVWLSADL